MARMSSDSSCTSAFLSSSAYEIVNYGMDSERVCSFEWRGMLGKIDH